jgi:hypothetical protein
MITSLKSIHAKCGKKMSIRKVQLALIRFEKMGFLSKQSSHINTLLTICNWDTYQSREFMNVKDDVKDPLDACHSTVTPALTNKNEKNVKIYKKHRESDCLSLDGIDMEGFTPEELKDPALVAWLADDSY